MQIKNIDYINNILNKENNIISKGTILKGIISSQTENEINISMGEISLKLSKNLVQGNVGDEVTFEVLDNKNNKLTLNQILDNKQISTMSLKEDATFSITREEITLDNSIAYKNFLNKTQETNSKDNIFSIKQLKNNINHISNAISENSVSSIFENFLTPEKNNLSAISTLISESFGVDLKSKENAQNCDEEKISNMKMDLNMNGIDEEAIFNYEETLLKNGLSATPKNIKSLQNLQGKFENLNELNNEQIYNLIKKNNNITLEDLYTIKHTGYLNQENINLENIKDIDGQINNILTNEKIDLTKENIQLAKNFVENQVEISKENFEKYAKLSNIQNEFNLEEILEKGSINIGLNKPITEIELFPNTNNTNLFKDYKNLVEILPNVTAENIQNLINNNINVNLKNIQNEYENQNNYDNIQISQEAISKRLTLAKIQMKLTTEVIYNLSTKGIDINTKPLENVISTLENIEIENYKNVLKITETPVNNQNISQLQKVFSSISSFYPNLAYSTFKEIIDNKIDFSISGISNSIKSKNILDTFETFKTVPNASFGDKISNLQNEFEKILTENNFEINDANLKASKILTLNNIDFNEENLLNVKLIDSKIDYIHNNLHPIIASNMIKDGLNPMEKSIDDLIDYINDFSNEFGQTSKEKIAEQILELDNDNKLTREERNAVIAVYRMLNLIEKNNSSSIGMLLKNERNITLGNLLNTSKTFTKIKSNNNIDFKINDNAEIEEKVNSENSIATSIEKGLNLQYNTLILKGIINNSTPEKILEYTKMPNDISIENIYNELKSEKNTPIAESTKETILTKARDLSGVSQDILNYMIKNNIPITINNITHMEAIIKDKFKNSNSIEEFENELKARGIDFGESIIKLDGETYTLDKALKTIDNINTENDNAFDDILTLTNLEDIKYMILKSKNLSYSTKFINDVNLAKNGIYSLPLRLSNGNITDLNMLILNDTALNEKNTSLFLQFENNSNLQAYIKVSENGTIANITTETNAQLENIANIEQDILLILKKFEIEPTKVFYSTESNKNIFDLTHKEEILNKLENLDNEFEITI